MGAAVVPSSGKAYTGVFGGGGSSSSINMSQYGTAFFIEGQGGPLAVNAFGSTNHRNVGLFGVQVGYQWPELLTRPFNSPWGLVPAVELEGYYLGKGSFSGHEINNITDRLPEHDFYVKYPMKTRVFLANAILNFNLPEQHSKFQPYVGVGIGAANISITDAVSLQTAPPEPGVNHYNSRTSDNDSTFAAQAKLGLNYLLNDSISVFAEYRWLYVASSDYVFGSTVYPDHAATSPWQVRLDAQSYNLGAVGIRYLI